MVIDARSLILDFAADARPINDQIKFAVEEDLDRKAGRLLYDPWNIHSWYWCTPGTNGYRKPVHPR